eukprot:g42762.t1
MAYAFLNPILLPSSRKPFINTYESRTYLALLNTLNDLASTAFCSNDFYRFTTFWLKKFLLILALKACPSPSAASPPPQHYLILHRGGGDQNCSQYCSIWPNQTPSTNTLIRLTELVLTLNNFFHSSHFLQTKGVAMGTRMGPSYAGLFVGYMEQSHFRSQTGTTLHFFLHYIDDCIGTAKCSHEELEQFINFTNTFHPNLKFTGPSLIPLSPSWTFVSISGDHLKTDIYFKPTDSHSYQGYTSSHPPSCKNAILYSQFLHLCRICSQDEAFHSQTSQMSSYFNNRNFPLQ